MKNYVRMNMKKYSVAIILLIFVWFVMYLSFKYAVVFDSGNSTTPIKEMYGKAEDDFGLQVTNKHSTNKDKKMGRLLQKNLADELNVAFTPTTGTDRKFIMKVFYNYEEVNFKVRNEKKFTSINNYYEFKVAVGEEINIPIIITNIISANDQHAKLIVSVFDSSIYAKDYGELSNVYGLSVVYDVIYTKRIPKVFTPILRKDAFQVPTTIVTERFPESIFHGVMITNELNLDKYDRGIPFPPNNLQVKSGEEIELAYIVGDPKGRGDDHFIIIGLLGWEQVKMNANSFLPVKIDPNHTSLGYFKIKAPNQAGLYEFVAFMIPVANSFHTRGYGYEETDVSAAYRFTVEVQGVKTMR